MKCEYCGRILRQGDTIHGIRYGTLTTTGFKAAQDSAVTVICGDCGFSVYSIVYGSLNTGKIGYPGLYKIYDQLTSVMKNGYNFIYAMGRLPHAELIILQRLISSCIPRN